MKITLIYPGISNIGFNSLGRGGHDAARLNLGLGYIAAYLKRSGHQVDLIDLRELKDWDHTRAEIKSRGSDVYGIQFNTINFDNAMACAGYARELGKTVVAGGPHATIAPEEILSSGKVDYVITGEGEISVTRLVNGLEKGQGGFTPIIKGERPQDLDALPFPDRSLYNMRRILASPYIFPFPEVGDVILVSRGCAFNCSFCQPLDRMIFGPGVRYRSVENVLQEIRYVRGAYDINYIHFDDEIFTFRKEWVKDFCLQIKKREPGLEWSVQSRVDLFDEEIAQWLSDAGCICVTFGFESGSPRMLQLLRKGITPEQSLRAARLCKKYDLAVFANYMLGMPTETGDELEMTYRLLKEIRPQVPSVSYFTPIPGSSLYQYCHSRGLILIREHRDFTRSPVGEKIKGVDYALLAEYVRRINLCVPRWYEQVFLARLALKRWLRLGQSGYLRVACKELIRYTSPALYNLLLLLRDYGRRAKGALRRLAHIALMALPAVFFACFWLVWAGIMSAFDRLQRIDSNGCPDLLQAKEKSKDDRCQTVQLR